MTPGLWAVIGEGLKLVERLVEEAINGNDNAKAAALAVVRSLLEGHSGSTDPQVVLHEIEQIAKSLGDKFAARDAQLLSALHDRFKK